MAENRKGPGHESGPKSQHDYIVIHGHQEPTLCVPISGQEPQPMMLDTKVATSSLKDAPALVTKSQGLPHGR